MKHFLFIFLFICYQNVVSQSNPVLDQFITTLDGASVGISVTDLNSEKNILAYHEDQVFTPASVLKIITTATAIELLGSDYTFKTILATDRNDPQHLLIHGYGDPTLGSEYMNNNSHIFLEEWAIHIKKNLSTEKPVRITVIDNYFGYTGVSPKWIQEDLGNYFAAGSYGISVFDNSYKLYFNTVNTVDYPKIIKTVPEMKDLTFFNTLTTNSSGRDNGYIQGNQRSNQRTLIGDIPSKRTSFFIKGDIPDPGMMLADFLSEHLTSIGFSVKEINTTYTDYFKNKPKQTQTPLYEEVPFYTHKSPPLKDIIRIINVRSNNHYAEHLIRTVGRYYNSNIYINPLLEGLSFTKNYWKERGIDTDRLFAYDGSGLAPSNKISPKLLSDILVYMKNKSIYSDLFFNSLPVSGKEGTVKNVLKGNRIKGSIVMKSGSIADVQCFAGYYSNETKQYAFAVMVNNYNNSRKEVVRAIENLLVDIFEYN